MKVPVIPSTYTDEAVIVQGHPSYFNLERRRDKDADPDANERKSDRGALWREWRA